MEISIRKATLTDTLLVATLLKEMYEELYPKEDLLDNFKELAETYLKSCHVFLFQDKAFFIIKNEATCVLKYPIWNGIAVYIRPEYRHTRILKNFYSYMFKHFEGRIFGFTEVQSTHNQVLNKRHKLVGYVYELERN